MHRSAREGNSESLLLSACAYRCASAMAVCSAQTRCTITPSFLKQPYQTTRIQHRGLGRCAHIVLVRLVRESEVPDVAVACH
eukprot:COSAG06_NODE_37287_length_437_cov_0.615385_1_plen_81_part_10